MVTILKIEKTRSISEKDIWKQVSINNEFYPYYVNQYGDIRSKKNPNKLLKQFKNHKGYFAVKLFKNFSHQTFSVHRIVACTFLGYYPGLQVNHINGDKTDNSVSNLEWVTCKENINHGWKNGLYKKSRKGSHSNVHKHNDMQIHCVCMLLEFSSLTSKEIAKQTGVSKYVIDKIRVRMLWTHISKYYNF